SGFDPSRAGRRVGHPGTCQRRSTREALMHRMDRRHLLQAGALLATATVMPTLAACTAGGSGQPASAGARGQAATSAAATTTQTTAASPTPAPAAAAATPAGQPAARA